MSINIKKLILECIVIEESWKNAKNQNSTIPEEELRQLAHKDPSNDKYFLTKSDETQAPNKYLPAIAKWYRTNQISLNDSHVYDVLEIYDELKRQNKLEQEHKNIAQFRNFRNFAGIMDKYIDENSKIIADEEGNVNYGKNVKKIYDNNGWQVWATKTYKASYEFIKYLYDMEDSQMKGWGKENYEQGICPYCIMRRNFWDKHAKGDPDYTLYWILKDKHEPDIVKGEGHDKVFAMTDTAFDILDEEDEYYEKEDLEHLPPEFWKIINGLEYHTFRDFKPMYLPYVSDEIKLGYINYVVDVGKEISKDAYNTLPKDLRVEYLKNFVEKNGVYLKEYEYEDLTGDLKLKYLENRVSNVDVHLSNHEYADLTGDLKLKYLENRVDNHRYLYYYEYADLPEDLKLEYLEKRAKKGDSLTDYEYKDLTTDLPEDLKLEYLKKRVKKKVHLKKDEYKDLPDDLKLEYLKNIDMSMTDYEYKDLPDDLKMKYLKFTYPYGFIPKDLRRLTPDSVLKEIG